VASSDIGLKNLHDAVGVVVMEVLTETQGPVCTVIINRPESR